MLKLHAVVAKWFACWEFGKIEELPITEDFSHTSPFGTIRTKEKYLEIVRKNKENFLGNKIRVLQQIKEGNNICVRFSQNNAMTGLSMEVCEWYVIENDERIREINSYYNIGNAVIQG